MESPLRAWNRLKTIGTRLGWKSLGVVVSLAIATFAFISLSHALKGVDFNDVLAAMRLTPPAMSVECPPRVTMRCDEVGRRAAIRPGNARVCKHRA